MTAPGVHHEWERSPAERTGACLGEWPDLVHKTSWKSPVKAEGAFMRGQGVMASDRKGRGYCSSIWFQLSKHFSSLAVAMKLPCYHLYCSLGRKMGFYKL